MEPTEVKKVIHSIGGPTFVSRELGVHVTTVVKWCTNGVVPKYEHAKKLAEMAGCSVAVLRPSYDLKEASPVFLNK